MFFKYAGSKTRSRTRIGPLVDDKGNVVDNDNVTAEMFNAYFASVFTKEREAVPDAVNMCNNDQEGDVRDTSSYTRGVLWKVKFRTSVSQTEEE